MIIELAQEGFNWLLANPRTAFIAVSSFVGTATVALRAIAPLTKWKGDNKALAFMRDILSILSLDSEAKKIFERMGLEKGVIDEK